MSNPAMTGTVPDVVEAGRVLAQLNDWRAIIFVLVFIIVVMILERIWTQREQRIERQQMRDIAAAFAQSATKVGDALSSLREEIVVLRAVSSRVESTTTTAPSPPAPPVQGDDHAR